MLLQDRALIKKVEASYLEIRARRFRWMQRPGEAAGIEATIVEAGPRNRAQQGHPTRRRKAMASPRREMMGVGGEGAGVSADGESRVAPLLWKYTMAMPKGHKQLREVAAMTVAAVVMPGGSVT
ncbi:hypothetical protein B296_00042094 [Ensete ventricosum]|uniref:Uncharacterized protein n=1 Tax=Ensete ventricosum TaxID=4639 RepID=A0A426Y431_ENSVE|nr:hypothetical protein B296_00042094 [Ensete ventricosum]